MLYFSGNKAPIPEGSDYFDSGFKAAMPYRNRLKGVFVKTCFKQQLLMWQNYGKSAAPPPIEKCFASTVMCLLLYFDIILRDVIGAVERR